MATNKDKVLAWHFLPASLKLSYSDGRTAKVGQTLTILSGMPKLCENGMHASVKISQAAGFTRGPVLTRVEVSGDVSSDSNKICGRSRKVLWMKKIEGHDLIDIINMLGEDPEDDLDDLTGDDDNDCYIITSTLEVLRTFEDFDDVLEAWAVHHGCPIKAKLKFNGSAKKFKVLPRPTVKDVLKHLDYRTVVTLSELRRKFPSGVWKLTAVDNGTYDDIFEEILDDHGEWGDKIHVIKDFTRHGGVGLLRINKK